MSQRFVIADTHFSHKGVCEFLREDGSKLRPWSDPQEMDEFLVQAWNSTVHERDTVYHLGDVAINRRGLAILGRLNGSKVLVKGNHDIFQLKDYTKYFRDIRAYVVKEKVIMSHIPVHPDSKGRFIGNIHGHLHARSLPDPWYQCVCVEQTQYRPVLFDVMLNLLRSNYDTR